LASCHSPQHEARQMVRRAELLFDTDSDSTVALIDSVLRMPVYFNEKRRMGMALLQAEALFGNRDGQEVSPLMDDEFFDDKLFLSTSLELERVADYYAKKREFDKAAHAALYSGFVQQHFNEKTVAMQSFKDAEHYGGLTKDSLTMAIAEYKMGKLLLDDGMKQESFVVLKSAESGFGHYYIEKALVKNMMGVCCMLQGDYGNAETSLQQSLSMFDIKPENKLKHKALNNYAVLSRLQGKHEQAIAYLKQIEQERNLDNTDLLMLYMNFGDVYLEANKLDSATLFYEKVKVLLLEDDIKISSIVSAYNSLSHFAKKQGDISLALQYCEMNKQQLYEMMSQRQEQTIYRIQQQYDYENLQNVLNRKIILRHRIILIISLLLLVATVIILVLQIRQKRMLEAEAEMKRQIDNLKNDLRESVKTPYLEQELSSRIRLIVAAYHTKKNAYDPKMEWSPIVFRLMNGKETIFDAVLEEIEKVYPHILAVLVQKYPELNETETKVCMLSCTNLSNLEMAEILGISKHTVDKNRSKLRDKMNLKPERLNNQLHQVLSH
jgi:DNA-binding CsgD family transcriptional regulator/tetratricopeptide (TPR) repeat protein